MPGDLTCRGKIVKVGNQFSSSESFVFDTSGRLLASGRGTYLSAPPKI
jgi:acyl-coenzyme A thioesterase PaaI-like protein